MKTFGDVQQRYNYLIGESTSTADDAGKSHINWAILDIVNRYPFNWNIATADLTLSAGVASLPADYNANYKLKDARIVTSSGADDDNVFTMIDVSERDQYTESDYVYWITYNSLANEYTFNSPTRSGTVPIYYYFVPSELSSTADYCIVPDAESVAYLAAAKNWVGDERNTQLQLDYIAEADKRIECMRINNLAIDPITGINLKSSLDLIGVNNKDGYLFNNQKKS